MIVTVAGVPGWGDGAAVLSPEEAIAGSGEAESRTVVATPSGDHDLP